MTKSIRLALPSVGAEELEEIRKVLETGYLTQGPAVAQFEKMVAEYVGVEYAFAMTSATTALHLSLIVVGVEPGDDVVVPAFTFPATANVVVQIGARPVFADIELETFAVTGDSVKGALTPATVAVMPVDPFGYPAPMNDIVTLARDQGMAVVEDAACALGARHAGTYCGGYPDLGCFSFHPRKVITTGEGGMITTNDEGLAERIRLLRNHGGRPIGGRPSFEAPGFNYRMSDVQGAMGIAQMRKLRRLLDNRREFGAELNRQLGTLPGVRVPQSREGDIATLQSYVVLLEAGIDRDRAIDGLKAKGVESTVGTYGLHLEPYFRDTFSLSPDMFPNATIAARQSLTLPLYPDMTTGDVDRIASSLDEVLRSA